MNTSTTKKRIALLICGQTRTNPLSNNSVKHEIITDAWDKYIFSEKFKELYSYDIYISTDNINIDNAQEYFGKDNVKNIHTLDNDWYLNPVETKIPTQKELLPVDKIPPGYWDYPAIPPMYYKVYDCYNLMKNNHIEYDYITRLRFDTVIQTDILECLNRLEQDGQELVLYADMFFIGKKDIMCYILEFIHSVNKHTAYCDKTLGSMIVWGDPAGKLPPDEARWAYSAEGQISEYLRLYYLKQNVEAGTKIICMNMSRIIRDNGHIEPW
jgi:hypothetical protein